MKEILTALTLLFSLTSCTQMINEGTSRLSSHPVGENKEKKEEGITLNGKIFFEKEKLNKKGDNPIIQDGDHFSITMMSAFICDVHEGGLLKDTWERISDHTNSGATPCAGGVEVPLFSKPFSKRGHETRGEVAILASVKSLSDVNAVPTDFSSPYDFGRVIYYNEDIRETGQLLNSVNIPIYGPIKYQKGPLEFRLALIEFDDKEDKGTQEFVSGLASMGGTIYPPSAPILGILNKLGETLITTNRDDVEFAFQATFDPPSKKSRVYRMPLQEGYYAILRQENRSDNAAWAKVDSKPPNFVICPEKGRLMLKSRSTQPGCEEEYRDHTWFLIRVAKEDPDVALAQDVGQTLSEFLKANQQKLVKDYQAIDDILGELGKEIRDLVSKAKQQEGQQSEQSDAEQSDGNDPSNDDG